MITINEIINCSPDKVGRKAWNIGQLYQYGFNVPHGIVLTADIYSDICKTIINGNLSANQKSELIKNFDFPNSYLELLQAKLKAEDLDKDLLAIRSSTTDEDSEDASFAGIYDSYLNIPADNIALVARKIIECYASLWSTRAIGYREFKNILKEPLGCIIIMPMINLKAGGVLFTCDPINLDKSIKYTNILPNSVEDVVQGGTQVDTVVMRTSAFGYKIDKDLTSSSYNLLTQEELFKLAHLGDAVEMALSKNGKPFDIEWGFDGEKFILFQGREVTSKIQFVPDKDLDLVWSNGNIQDASPDVQSILSQSLMRSFIRRILLTPFRAVGYKIPDGVNWHKIIGGRAYFNLTALQYYYLKAFGVPPKELNRGIGGYQPAIDIRQDEGFLTNFSTLLNKLTLGYELIKLVSSIEQKKTALELTKDIITYEDLSVVSNQELWEKIAACGELFDEFSEYFQMMNVYSALGYDLLEKFILYLESSETTDLTNRLLLRASGNIDSANYVLELKELAKLLKTTDSFSDLTVLDGLEVKAKIEYIKSKNNTNEFWTLFNQFLKKYGHRCVYEMEIANPRWQEDPSFLITQIQSIYSYTNDAETSPARGIDDAHARFNQLLGWNPIYNFIGNLTLNLVITSSACRENTKSALVMAMLPMRIILLEVGRRLQEAHIINSLTEVFNFSIDDIYLFLNDYQYGNVSGLRVISQTRSTLRILEKETESLDVYIDKSNTESQQIILDTRSDNTDPSTGTGLAMHGIGISPGTARGKACRINHPDEHEKLKSKQILVARSTDPGWSSLFFKAKGVVLGVGGQLSHGAIICRELEIPAIANLKKHEFDSIQDDDQLEINGDFGSLTKIR